MDLDKRLAMAQVLAGLLKQERIIRFVGKPDSAGDEANRQEIEEYVKKHIHNLLFNVMGEVPSDAFTQEETAILKSMVAKIKNGVK